jgi:hypothetical protein
MGAARMDDVLDVRLDRVRMEPESIGELSYRLKGSTKSSFTGILDLL